MTATHLLFFWYPAGEPEPTPIVQSTGGGGGYRRGERKERGLAWDKRNESQDIEAWLSEAYAELTGENTVAEVAATVAEVVAPYREEGPTVDWVAFAQNAQAIRELAALYDRHLAEIEAQRKWVIAENEAAFMLMMQ